MFSAPSLAIPKPNGEKREREKRGGEKERERSKDRLAPNVLTLPSRVVSRRSQACAGPTIQKPYPATMNNPKKKRLEERRCVRARTITEGLLAEYGSKVLADVTNEES